MFTWGVPKSMVGCSYANGSLYTGRVHNSSHWINTAPEVGERPVLMFEWRLFVLGSQQESVVRGMRYKSPYEGDVCVLGCANGKKESKVVDRVRLSNKGRSCCVSLHHPLFHLPPANWQRECQPRAKNEMKTTLYETNVSIRQPEP